jgi:RHS repeat-associated protein
VAQGLAQAINNDSSSPVTAIAAGGDSNGVVALTAKTTGTATNYSYSVSVSSESGMTVVTNGSTLIGGTNATPASTVYDAGTITAAINGNTTTAVTWQQGSTPSSIASALASAINSKDSSFLTATVASTGTDIDLVSKSTGSTTDWPITLTITDTETAFFTSPSFSLGSEGMFGGDTGTIYSYSIPEGGYAPNGNILSHSDSVTGTWNFGYDTLNRLTTSKITATTTYSASYANQSGCWSYDGFGNRQAELYSDTACPTHESSLTPQFTYNPTTASANNQIATAPIGTYLYDQAGNVIQDALNQYAYDAEGRLCAVENANSTITQYFYDASGTRTSKVTLTGITLPASSSTYPAPVSSLCTQVPITANTTQPHYYLLDSGGDQVTELADNPTTGVFGWFHTNAFTGGHLSATYDTYGLHFHLSDPLGTRRMQLNTLGQIEESCFSLPYGDQLSCTKTALSTADDATEHHFTGKERDTESGNDYFGARYYASSMGRWMSPDWNEKVEPVPYSKLDDPQTLNLYTYVLNNPLVLADADGHTTDTYVPDIDKHGGAHIDRYTKGGQNVGRYRPDGTPIKFKGKTPGPVPNADKGKFGEAAAEIEKKQQARQQEQNLEENPPPVPAPPTPDGLKPDPPSPFPFIPGCYWCPNQGPDPSPKPMPFPGPAPGPIPLPEPTPFPIPEPIPVPTWVPIWAANHPNNVQ